MFAKELVVLIYLRYLLVASNAQLLFVLHLGGIYLTFLLAKIIAGERGSTCGASA